MLLFVCGFPSGGTDLVKTVLNAHPDIFINGEMPRLLTLAPLGFNQNTRFRSLDEIRTFQRHLAELNVWNNITNVHHDFSARLDEAGELSLLEVLKTCFSTRQRKVWGNKTPQNTEHIGALSTLFPDARFLVVTRDVRDVCLSWQRKWGKNPIYCAHKWSVRMRQGWRDCALLPRERYLFIRYEDLLTDKERICRAVCTFLELPFSLTMLEHDRHTDNIPDGKLKYGQKIDPSNKDKWRQGLGLAQTKRIEEIAVDTMHLFGYSTSYEACAHPLTPLERLVGECRDTWAAVTIGNRASRDNTLAVRLRSVARQVVNRLSG